MLIPTTITSAGIVSGSRQRNSISPRARGTRSRTHTIVGTSSATISTTVKSASSSDATIEARRSSSVTMRAQLSQVRPGALPRTWVEKSNIASSGTKK